MVQRAETMHRTDHKHLLCSSLKIHFSILGLLFFYPVVNVVEVEKSEIVIQDTRNGITQTNEIL